MGWWAPQEVLPSPVPRTVIPCNDPGWGLAVQNTDVVDRELQRVQQHPLAAQPAAPQLFQQAQGWDLSSSAHPVPSWSTLSSPVQKGIEPCKSRGGTPTPKLWSRAGAQDAWEESRQRRHLPAAKSELLFRELPSGKRGACRPQPAQEGLSVRGKCLWSW